MWENVTWANLPRANADISLNWASGDWSISISGGTAPLWTMWTCRGITRIFLVTHKLGTIEKAFLWNFNNKVTGETERLVICQPYSLNLLQQIAQEGEQLLFDSLNSRSCNSWMSTESKIQINQSIFYFTETLYIYRSELDKIINITMQNIVGAQTTNTNRISKKCRVTPACLAKGISQIDWLHHIYGEIIICPS